MSPGAEKIPAEMFQAGEKTLRSAIQKLIKLTWNKVEIPHQWKESIVVTNHKKVDKIDCSNYRGTLLPST
jgi:hypothetical protein